VDRAAGVAMMALARNLSPVFVPRSRRVRNHSPASR
jgi:hypothetical protein